MSHLPSSARASLERTVRQLGPPFGAVLLAPVLLLALPLWVVSAITRWLSHFLEPSSLPWQDLIEYEPVVGARTRPNLDVYGRGEDVFRLTTDPEGWRGQTALDEADVVVFGDSFAFGHGVDDDQVYAERTPGLEVKPIASDAYSMVHGLLWMQRLAPRLAGKTVVWFVYCGNDLADNLRPNQWHYRMPFVKGNPDESWEIVTKHVSPEPWTFRPPLERENPQRLFAELCTPSWYTERVFSAADFLIGEAARICRHAGATLTVLSIPLTKQIRDPDALRAMSSDPDRVDLDLPDRRLAQSCAEHAVSFVALKPHVTSRHYWRHDMHWNAAGHRVVAKLVANIHHRPAPHGASRPQEGTVHE